VEVASVTVDASALGHVLLVLERQGKNTREVMHQISLVLVEEVDEMFETSGHGKWEPFSKNTRRKRGSMSAAKLLIDTTHLVTSITEAYSQTEAEAFTNVSYAKYHVSDAPRSKIPKRDFFDIDLDKVTEEAVDLVLVELTK
jgi:phage gpG-like protein